MREDEYPRPLSDPEAEGLPGTADDDGVAEPPPEDRSVRAADGLDPAALPTDSPVAVDRWGTTGEEAAIGESLDFKLAREQTEAPVDNPLGAPADQRINDDEDLGTPTAQSQVDADVLDAGPVFHPNSKVSLYDVPEIDIDSVGGAPIGRLVEPDEGAHSDNEGDSIAYDAGPAGGGATAEEAAMHETEPPPLT